MPTVSMENCIITVITGALEIKLGANQIDKAAENLLTVNEKIKQADGVPASTLIVVCGLANAAYQRPDGVFVVPITALKN